MIGQTISHYRILEKLGEGGMGIVYRAHDSKLERIVALKFLSPELVRDHDAKARLVREAQAAAALTHPNICTIHEIDEYEGLSFIAMECCEGQTLKQRIASGRLRPPEAVDIAQQIAQGLARAHEREIVHRDIKPANIFITKDHLVKIVDFGLAKLAGQTRLTKSGTTPGTIAYMSPEQVRGEKLGGQSDIWSLGVVLFEMLTGKLPFPGETDSAVIYNILNSDPVAQNTLAAETSPGLARIIARCLAKDSRQRYQCVEDLLGDLRQLADGGASADLETVKLASSRPWRSRAGLWLRRTGAAATVLLACWIIYHYTVRSGSSPARDRIMLAVLPFANLGSPQDETFCAGITDVITARLAGIKGLGVISRQSTLPYRGSRLSARKIGTQLGVEYILEGTIQRETSSAGSDRVRIVPLLIRVRDDIHVWAGTFDEPLQQVFEAQTSIARRVAHELDITLLAPASMESAAGIFDRESSLKQARSSILGALAAYDQVPPETEVARGLLASAIRSLSACGLLKPGEEQGEALARSFRTALAQTMNGKDADRDFVRILADLRTPHENTPAVGGQPGSQKDGSQEFSLEAELGRVFAEFGVNVAQQPLPPSLVGRVQHYLELYTGDWRSFTEKALDRSRAFLPMIHQELTNYGLPKALAAMPLILSGYKSDLAASSGAAGLWCFMPRTARDYGLVVDPPARDDRMDPYKHTIAACQHFDYLLRLFGSSAPLCAVAAYNSGIAGLAACLKSEGDWRSAWRFWDLAEKEASCLSDETRNFVPRFLAAVVVMRRPDAFGMSD